MATRKVANPKNPEPLALLVNSMDRITRNTPGLTEAEHRLAKRLATGKHREVMTRLVTNFRKIPEQRRIQAFGTFGIPDLKPTPVERLKQAFSGLQLAPGETVIARADGLGEVSVPSGDPLDRFSLTYTGLYCQDETDWDGFFTSSDEAYIITSVIEEVNGANVVRTEKHPFSQVEYGDIDSGEWRSGPVAACWEGSANEISLTTAVMERDYGDPNHFKEEIDGIVNAALDTLEYVKIPHIELLRKLTNLIIDAVNWLLGTADDLIDTTTRIISEDVLKVFGAADPKFLVGKREVLVPVPPLFGGAWTYEKKTVTDVTDVAQHFTTTHKGGGATYVVGYRVRKRRLAFPATPVVA